VWETQHRKSEEAKMHGGKTWLGWVLAAAILIVAAGCSKEEPKPEGLLESIGKKADKAIDAGKDATDKAVDKTRQAADEGLKKAGEAVKPED